MLGILPTSLKVNEKEYKIRSDFRVALLIFEAFNDPNLNDHEKILVCVNCLFEDVPDDITEAYKSAVQYLNGGETERASVNKRKVFDWKQDEKIIFSAVNKVAGKEVRLEKYMHWWTFLGYFSEIGEGLFSQVVNIRIKRSKGRKLEKYEQEFYRENKEIIDLKKTYSDDEQAEINRLKNLMDGD